MRLSLLHDAVPAGAPPDLADNLAQAQQMAAALARLGHEASLCAWQDSPAASLARLAAQRPQAVFNLVETPLGRASRIHAAPIFLERAGLAFAGAGGRAMLITSHKLLAKRALATAGLPTPAWRTMGGRGQGPERGPWLIKAVWEHGSVGIDENSLAPAHDPARLSAALAAKAAQVGGPCFAEAYVEGREFNLALLAGPNGPELLPPAEILFEGYSPGQLRVVGYRAKWEAGSFEYQHTPRRQEFPAADQALLGELGGLARRCWGLFGLRGWARVDFRVDRAGRPFILEVNANPCLAADAGFMAAAQRAGLDQAAVAGRILADALASAPGGRT
ncbi:MAG: D-alanine--D-alanine ligase [Desulfarculus sp.]|nr:MAG: D-alanine--D-alanine ligase [Desulfarculus sp.]